MPKPQRYTAAEVIAAIKHTRGMLTLAAERLGCSDETMYNYAKRYPSVAEAIKQQRDRVLDITELKLQEAVNAGESWAVQFMLRTIGKERGYVERHEVTGKDGDSLHIHLSWGDASDHEAATHLNGGPPALTSGPAPNPEESGTL
jgi:hypothetical protein